MNQLENRQNKRVEFFNIPMGEHEIRPIWVFSSGNSESSICGVVVNMSKSGIQILTDANSSIKPGKYKLSFIQDQHTSALNLSDCEIDLVWTETRSSINTVSGFNFTEATPENMQLLLNATDNHVRPFIRCEIDKIEPVNPH